ncbi:MAG: hypothetical protein HC842_04355, partial [Cytophagales bacterium]|nr:hypothetical protein [Cytophagales bacterium]
VLSWLLSQRELYTIHLFLPITAQREINTWPIIHGLWQAGRRVVVPQVLASGQTMRCLLLQEDTPLKKKSLGNT